MKSSPFPYASIICLAVLVTGCTTTPVGTVQTRVERTLRGAPVQITRISLPLGPEHTNAQVAAGSAWATDPSPLGTHKTLRVNTTSYQVVEYSRPWTAGAADLLIGENAIWFSDGMPQAGHGDIYRADLDTHNIIATIKAAGAPFDIGDHTVWAYNFDTRVVTGTDTKSNRIRVTLPVQHGPGATRFSGWQQLAFGAGSIWQFAPQDGSHACRPVDGVFPSAAVRRIDPNNGRIIAEIPVGPFCLSDRIRFVEGSIWLLGERTPRAPGTRATAYAARIDARTNQLAATIPLTRSMICAAHPRARTPVLWNGAVWVSTFCTDQGRMPGVMLKIDLETNQVTDELGLSLLRGHLGGQPVLAVGADGFWGFDGRSAIRFDFQREPEQHPPSRHGVTRDR